MSFQETPWTSKKALAGWLCRASAPVPVTVSQPAMPQCPAKHVSGRALHVPHARKRRLQSRLAQFMCGSCAPPPHSAHADAAGSWPSLTAASDPALTHQLGNRGTRTKSEFTKRQLSLLQRGCSPARERQSGQHQFPCVQDLLCRTRCATRQRKRHCHKQAQLDTACPPRQPCCRAGARQARAPQAIVRQEQQCRPYDVHQLHFRGAHQEGPPPGGCQTRTGCRSRAGPVAPAGPRRLLRRPPARPGRRARRRPGCTGF